MVPTAQGAIVFVIAAVLYALAWQTQIGWFYVAGALSWAILLVNLVLPWVNLWGLSAERRVLAHSSRIRLGQAGIFEEDQVSIQIEINNCSFLPKGPFILREHCPIADPQAKDITLAISAIAAGSRVTATYDVRCYQRGVYDFRPLVVETSAPFGLFRSRRRLEAPLKIVVYPLVLPLGGSLNQGVQLGQLRDSLLAKQGGELRGSREYQPGDQVKNIHWRNSARRSNLMVKEYDEASEENLSLAFNPGFVLGQGRDNTLEYSIKIAASLAYWCFRQGKPFYMRTHSQKGTTSSWHGVLEHLAHLDTRVKVATQEVFRPSNVWERLVVIVSAADTESLQLVQQQRLNHGRTIAILLEEFGPGENLAAVQNLSSKGMTVVVCNNGRLPDALGSLSKALSPQMPIVQQALSKVIRAKPSR